MIGPCHTPLSLAPRHAARRCARMKCKGQGSLFSGVASPVATSHAAKGSVFVNSRDLPAEPDGGVDAPLDGTEPREAEGVGTHTLSLSLSPCLSLCLSVSFVSLSLSLCLSVSMSLCLSPSLCRSLSHCLCLAVSLSLSRSLALYLPAEPDGGVDAPFDGIEPREAESVGSHALSVSLSLCLSPSCSASLCLSLSHSISLSLHTYIYIYIYIYIYLLSPTVASTRHLTESRPWLRVEG